MRYADPNSPAAISPIAILGREGDDIDAPIACAGALRPDLGLTGSNTQSIRRCVTISEAVHRLVLSNTRYYDGDRITFFPAASGTGCVTITSLPSVLPCTISGLGSSSVPSNCNDPPSG